MSTYTTNLNNFVIDRVLRGVFQSQSTGNEVLFAINQIQNPSLNCASESADAVDALGTPVATFYRSKTAEFSAENAIFDMGLLAQQVGQIDGVAKATADSKITVPTFEKITLEQTGDALKTSYSLRHVPTLNNDSLPDVTYMYEVNNDGTIGEKYEFAAVAADGKFNVAISGTTTQTATLTVPTNFAVADVGKQYMVVYNYLASSAYRVVNSAKKFPKGGILTLEVLGCNVCDQSNLMLAYLRFPNFKLSPDFDWSLQTDGAHPFSGKAMQEYCGSEKQLFELIIVDEPDDSIFE